MSVQGSSKALLQLARSFSKVNTSDPLTQCLAPRLCRTMATEAPLPTTVLLESSNQTPTPPPQSPSLSNNASQTTILPTIKPTPSLEPTQVLTTLYSWPGLEPLRFTFYGAKHLHLPLRRDILHRAIIYEADSSRQGTASTKWRSAVHGSNRKVLPQKGTGHARAGDKKSPLRKGGGVAFGPHPRDFSTEIQRKVYDLAWRTALSYRYRRGELIILDDKITLPKPLGGRYLANIFEGNQWGRGYGRTLLVTENFRERLFREMAEVGEHGLVKDMHDVDVKDILETGRIVVEKEALDTLLRAHGSDLGFKASMKFAMQADMAYYLEHGGLASSRSEKTRVRIGQAVQDVAIAPSSTLAS